MDDAEFLFRQTSRERKRVARGASAKVRGGGRTVRMPSDYLTRGERNDMNGDVKSYALGRPLSWGEFKLMPKDIQETYLNGLTKKFPGISLTMLAEACGTKPNTFNPYLFRHQIKVAEVGKSDKRFFYDTPVGRAYREWLDTRDKPVEEAGAEPVVDEPVMEEPVVEEVEDRPAISVDGKKMDVNNISVLLASLVGTGAKLTIEIVL